jgi:hypothetical protein
MAASPVERTPRTYQPPPPPAIEYEPPIAPDEMLKLTGGKPPPEFTIPLIPAPNDSLFEEGLLRQNDVIALLQRIV